MKIERAGSLRDARRYQRRPARFVCRACGCVFVADKNEYSDMSNQRDGDMYSCGCPCCGETCWAYQLMEV